jgi:phytoene dehydrogenase-like protein
MTRDGYDVAIVGAGPNGLTAAAYLARAGARVVVLEKRFERGGTFATDDYSTPFQYNLAQFELPLGGALPPYRDLDLRSHGIRFLEPERPFAAQSEPAGAELVIGRGGGGLGAEVEGMLAAISAAVTPLLYRSPLTEEELRSQLTGSSEEAALDFAQATPLSLAERTDDPRARIMLRYACGMAGFLDGSAPLGLVGAFAVSRLFSPTIVAGGTKNLANALYRVAAGAGARSVVSAPVDRIARTGEGFEVSISDGRVLGARTVISTLDPVSTFLELLSDEPELDALRRPAEDWAVEATGAFTAHYGIKGIPPAPAAGAPPDALTRCFGFCDFHEVEERFRTVADGELPGEVAGHLTAVSVHDPLQASPGPYGPLHCLRLQTMVPFRLAADDWDRARPAYRQRCWEAAVRHFRGLEDAHLLFQFADTPQDIARRFATTRGGTTRQGSLSPAQTLQGRPHPECSSGRTPVDRLYLGGGGVHPGVPGCLGGGYNAAGLVAEDLGLERWWPADALSNAT